MAKPIRLSSKQRDLQERWRMEIRALQRTREYREITSSGEEDDDLAGKLIGQLRGSRPFSPETLSAVSEKFGLDGKHSFVTIGKTYILSMLPHWPELESAVVEAKWISSEEAEKLRSKDRKDRPSGPEENTRQR